MQIGKILFQFAKKGLLYLFLLIQTGLRHSLQNAKQQLHQLFSTNNTTNAQFWRPLGNTEIIKEKLHHKGIHIISSVVFLSSKRSIQTNVLNSALLTLAQRHPLLRAKIAYENGKAYWQELSEITIDLRVDGTKNWLKCFENNFAEKFNTETGPLWRMTYLPEIMSDFDDGAFEHNCVLVWSFHHAIIDGHARAKLLNELVDILSESMSNGISHESIAYRNRNLQKIMRKRSGNYNTNIAPGQSDEAKMKNTVPESLESYVKSYLSQKVIPHLTTLPVCKQIHAFWTDREAIPNKNAFVEHIGVVQNIEPEIERKTSLVPLRFSVDETKTLLRACKMHGVSVQSAIQAAAAVSMTKFIAKNVKKRKWNFLPTLGTGKLICAASLHNSHKPEMLNNSNYVCNLSFDIPCDLPFNRATIEQFWELAQEYRANLVQNRTTFLHKSQLQNAILNKQKFAQYSEDQSVYNAGRNDTLLTFSNLGHCDFLSRETNSTIKVNALFSGLGEHISGPIFSNCIVTFNQRLCWGVVYYTNATTRTFAEQYLRRTRQVLLNACNS